MSMSLPSLLLLLVIAAICGAIGKAIAGGARGGLIVSIALGFAGALVGPWVAGKLGLSEPLMVTIGGHPFGVLWSIIGAAIFVAVIHLISRRKCGDRAASRRSLLGIPPPWRLRPVTRAGA